MCIRDRSAPDPDLLARLGELPHLRAAGEGGLDAERAFETGLACLLDGLRARVERSSAAGHPHDGPPTRS